MKSSVVHKCHECDKIFLKKFDFLEHKNTHTGDTPFMCINCRKCFSLIREYVNHIKSQHSSVKDETKAEIRFDGHFEKDAAFKILKSKNDNPEKVILTSRYLNENDDLHLCFTRPETFDSTKSFSNNQFCDNFSENLAVCKCCSCQIHLKTFEKHQLNNSDVIFCKKCDKKFSSYDKLTKHVCFILSGGSFQCSCSQTFTKASLFKNHVGNKPYSCCSCFMKFNTITNLIRHIRTHTKQKPYVCKDCGRGFSQSAHLKNHSSIHLGIRAVRCTECNFSCKTFNGLLKHKRKHKEEFLNHQDYVDGRKMSGNMSMCPICNKQFLFKRNLGMHMKIHSNKMSLCTECGKVFDSKGKLTSHHKACHKEPSVCKTCGKVFASAVLLSAHEKIHVIDKSFSCNFCQKRFSIKNYLVQHLKTHSNKKQFSCSKCGKLFKVAASLKYHSNICTSLNIPV